MRLALIAPSRGSTHHFNITIQLTSDPGLRPSQHSTWNKQKKNLRPWLSWFDHSVHPGCSPFSSSASSCHHSSCLTSRTCPYPQYFSPIYDSGSREIPNPEPFSICLSHCFVPASEPILQPRSPRTASSLVPKFRCASGTDAPVHLVEVSFVPQKLEVLCTIAHHSRKMSARSIVTFFLFSLLLRRCSSTFCVSSSSFAMKTSSYGQNFLPHGGFCQWV